MDVPAAKAVLASFIPGLSPAVRAPLLPANAAEARELVAFFGHTPN